MSQNFGQGCYGYPSGLEVRHCWDRGQACQVDCMVPLAGTRQICRITSSMKLYLKERLRILVKRGAVSRVQVSTGISPSAHFSFILVTFLHILARLRLHALTCLVPASKSLSQPTSTINHCNPNQILNRTTHADIFHFE